MKKKILSRLIIITHTVSLLWFLTWKKETTHSMVTMVREKQGTPRITWTLTLLHSQWSSSTKFLTLVQLQKKLGNYSNGLLLQQYWMHKQLLHLLITKFRRLCAAVLILMHLCHLLTAQGCNACVKCLYIFVCSVSDPCRLMIMIIETWLKLSVCSWKHWTVVQNQI